MKYTITILLLGIWVNAAVAQQIGLQLQGGVAGMRIYDGTFSDNTIGLTTGAGFQVESPLGKYTGLRTGIRYNYNRGLYDRELYNNSTTELRHKNSHWAIPIDLNIYFNEGYKKTFFIVGLAPVFGIRHKVVVRYTPPQSDFVRNEDITEYYEFRNNDLYGHIGMGYVWAIRPTVKLGAQACYTMNIPGSWRNIAKYGSRWDQYGYYNTQIWYIQTSIMYQI